MWVKNRLQNTRQPSLLKDIVWVESGGKDNYFCFRLKQNVSSLVLPSRS